MHFVKVLQRKKQKIQKVKKSGLNKNYEVACCLISTAAMVCTHVLFAIETFSALKLLRNSAWPSKFEGHADFLAHFSSLSTDFNVNIRFMTKKHPHML